MCSCDDTICRLLPQVADDGSFDVYRIHVAIVIASIVSCHSQANHIVLGKTAYLTLND